MSAHRRRLSVGLVAVMCGACGGTDVVLGDGRVAANEDAAAPVDTPSFSAPVVLDVLSSADTVVDDPSLSADLTEIYFNSKRDGGAGEEDIWRSKRTSRIDAWTPPEQVAELDTSDRETGIALAPDALTIWFSSNREVSAGLDIFTASRATRDEAWSGIHKVDELSSDDDDLVSAVGDAGQALLLARRQDDNDDYDLFVATRADDNALWQAPTPIDELNTSEEESDGFLLSDGLHVVFTQDQDLKWSTRDTASRPFTTVQALKELNSDADDRDAWLSADATYVVFSSNRTGSYLLYEAVGAWNPSR